MDDRHADPADGTRLHQGPLRQPLSHQLLNWLGLRQSQSQSEALHSATYDKTVQLAQRPGRSQVADELPGLLTERYELLRTLGRGASGIVYQAKDTRIGRIVAVKLLYRFADSTSLTYRRFLQEARIAGQIDSPHIVTIYDVDDSVPCILMEFLGGGNLADRLQQDAPFSEEHTLQLLRGILRGLDSAHANGVVHRDVKPQNILFDQYGNPRISDFGIAHLPVDRGGISEEEGWQSVAGTPNYMAPEQMIPGGEIDGRADLYATGIMAFEMLTGERPYRHHTATSLYELRESIDNAPMVTGGDFPPQISSKTRNLVLRLMQRQARKRFASAAQVINAIEDAMVELATVAEAQHVSRETVSVRIEMYEDILRMFLVDGVVSQPERRELLMRAQRLGVSARIARRAEDSIRAELGLPSLKDLERFETEASNLIADRSYSSEDRERLRALGSELGINLEQQRRIEDAVLVRYQMKKSDGDDAQPS